MSNSRKLSDVQLILLATASQREDGSLLPPPEGIGGQPGRIRKAVTSLIRRGFAEESDVNEAVRTWREEGSRRIGVIITGAGRAALTTKESVSAPVPSKDPEPAKESKSEDAAAATGMRAGTKVALVVQLLEAEGGVTLADLVKSTGWLPHTTRAALSGLRKRGHTIESEKLDGTTHYHIRNASEVDHVEAR